uniref:Uncharacterized protein n=1 Tax=Onchocerca volvulus TaxID=6282 RepID=A0A8R1TWG5_ONCVO
QQTNKQPDTAHYKLLTARKTETFNTNISKKQAWNKKLKITLSSTPEESFLVDVADLVNNPTDGFDESESLPSSRSFTVIKTSIGGSICKNLQDLINMDAFHRLTNTMNS